MIDESRGEGADCPPPRCARCSPPNGARGSSPDSELHRSVRVATLSEDLGVSEITIRRDLRLLEQEGVLARTHGGAVRRRHLTDEPSYEQNVVTHAVEKERIARAAAAMIANRATPSFSARARRS